MPARGPDERLRPARRAERADAVGGVGLRALGGEAAAGLGRGLDHRAAVAADEEGRRVARRALGAGDEGVERLDPVDEAVLHQEVERAVGHRRLGAEPGIAQL